MSQEKVREDVNPWDKLEQEFKEAKRLIEEARALLVAADAAYDELFRMMKERVQNGKEGSGKEGKD